QRNATVRGEHGVHFRGDASILVNARRARDPQQKLTRDRGRRTIVVSWHIARVMKAWRAAFVTETTPAGHLRDLASRAFGRGSQNHNNVSPLLGRPFDPP